MTDERKILRRVKEQHKEKLTALKSFMNELKEKCHDCDTEHDHVNPDMLQTENDVNFYESSIKQINMRLRELGTKGKK
jgi:hypothetical protein